MTRTGVIIPGREILTKASKSQLLLLEQPVLSKEYGLFEMPVFQMFPSKSSTSISPDTTNIVECLLNN